MGRGSRRLTTCWIPFGDIPIEQGTLLVAKREQINDFCTRAHAMLEADERIVEGHEVSMVNFGDSAIEVMVHAFVLEAGWSHDLAVNHEMRMRMWELADEIGLSFAFPSQSVYVESLPTSS